MGRKALIIDDNPEFAASVRDVLVSNGWTVTTAENGEKGVESAVAERPDLILLDVMMESSGTGLDVARTLRDNAATKAIAVFLVTGIRKPEFLLQSYAPGESFPNVKRVFEKPVEPQTLIGALAGI